MLSSTHSHRAIRFALFLIFVASTGAIAVVRFRNDLPLTPDAVRDTIRAWGPLGPLIFTGAFVLRPFIFFPSTLLFLAGGLAFGVAWGTVYAVIGGTLGAVVGFSVARVLGYDFVRAHLGDRLSIVRETRWGIGAVALLNLIPVVPMTVINYGAGLSGMDMLPFAAAVVAGLVPRAFAYSFFGNSLLHIQSVQFVVALLLLVVMLVVPLYFRRHLTRRATRAGMPPAA